MTEATRDKFFKATRTLATHAGPIKLRIREAFVPGLISLTPDELPYPDLWERFTSLRNELAPHQKQDVLLERWWDFELGRVAQEIVDIYDELTRRV